MKLYKLLMIPLVVACKSTAYVSSDSSQTETIEENLKVRPGGSIALRNVHGSIDVCVRQRNEVRLVTEKPKPDRSRRPEGSWKRRRSRSKRMAMISRCTPNATIGTSATNAV